MSMGLRLAYILLSILLSSYAVGQEAIYNAFLQDSIGVGENADLFITIEEKNLALVQRLDLEALENMQFYPAAPSQTDSIVSEKADISINSLGFWVDQNKDGVISGEEFKWEKVENNGEVVYRNQLNISFFDVGIYIFNGFSFSVNGKTGVTNRALMKVNFKEYDLEVIDSTGLAPIKDIERESLAISDFLPLLLYILLPLLLIYFGYKYYKKRQLAPKEIVPEEVIIIPPDVQALTELKDLRNKELWQKGEIKQYQSELSHIIREYLEGRYDIKALENTTRQIIRSIKDKSFTADDESKLSRILQISDLVKFAKAKPEVNIHEEFMVDAIEFVQRTRKPIDLKEEEE